MTATTFKFDIHELVDLAEAWKLAPDVVDEELTKAMWEAELLLEREVKERTPVGATSAAQESIAAEAPDVSDGHVLGIVSSSLAHITPLELGTKPHFPPIEPLKDWVRSVLGIQDDGTGAVYFVALAIARKIAAHGTKGAHMFEKALEENQGQVFDIFERAKEKIGMRLTELN